MLYLTGIIITFFLVVILASKKDKSEADKILAFWLFFTGFHLFLYYLHYKNDFASFPYLLGFELPMPLLQGPFLFLYTSALTNQNQHKKYNLLHFLPFIMACLILIPFFELSFEEKLKVFQNEGKGYENLILILYSAILISGITYALLSLRKLSKHRKNISEAFSSTEKINLRWLQYLILGSSIIWLVVILFNDEYIFSFVVFYLIFIGYFGIKQVGIFTNQALSENKIPNISSIENIETENSSEKIKYEKSSLTNSELQLLHQKLTQIMTNEKLYKNPDLTLADLSQKLNIHSNVLSQVINSAEEKNFYDYINSQRVQEFKKLIILPENQKFTLLSVAFECGFNSKTAFNRNFKKATGLSPSEYLK
ncbi:Helix-turn-helix domain-containing protein [Flavobacterium resistens]|uniref:Helix-turn-helix domain-containing protein n=1 Tax=Flavobacterium resistens TaxID=443612 RepID=A0A521E772_9FLAO|nr:helix-turn-helix domain-containing protein [Flavobacterium resistens]MRX69124.1 helix-turn-helix domain-containing protein [Flavobacterium resistens]SMO79712.1 Helix-turn-helix domain-containing protein [Flavobacterium resistens]